MYMYLKNSTLVFLIILCFQTLAQPELSWAKQFDKAFLSNSSVVNDHSGNVRLAFDISSYILFYIFLSYREKIFLIVSKIVKWHAGPCKGKLGGQVGRFFHFPYFISSFQIRFQKVCAFSPNCMFFIWHCYKKVFKSRS